MDRNIGSNLACINCNSSSNNNDNNNIDSDDDNNNNNDNKIIILIMIKISPLQGLSSVYEDNCIITGHNVIKSIMTQTNYYISLVK